MRLELGNNDAGNRINNLKVSALDTVGFVIGLEGDQFLSSAQTGHAVGGFPAEFNDVPETAAFALVSGAGDTDNAKFQIVGNELRIGAGFDFLNEPNGSTSSVRVSGLGDVSAETGVQVFPLTLIADTDSDVDGLTDGTRFDESG